MFKYVGGIKSAIRTAANLQRNLKGKIDLEIFSYFCSINLKLNTMTTITLSYNERNKTAQAVVKFLESLGVFKILKDDEPNATTIKAIEEVKSGKTYKASSLQDMLNYLRN